MAIFDGTVLNSGESYGQCGMGQSSYKDGKCFICGEPVTACNSFNSKFIRISCKCCQWGTSHFIEPNCIFILSEWD